MNKKNISFEFQNKIRKYINSIYDPLYNDSVNELKLVDKISVSLKEELLLKANRGIIEKFLFFKDNFSEETLRKIILAMKFKNYFPEEIITQVNLRF